MAQTGIKKFVLDGPNRTVVKYLPIEDAKAIYLAKGTGVMAASISMMVSALRLRGLRLTGEGEGYSFFSSASSKPPACTHDQGLCSQWTPAPWVSVRAND